MVGSEKSDADETMASSRSSTDIEDAVIVEQEPAVLAEPEPERPSPPETAMAPESSAYIAPEQKQVTPPPAPPPPPPAPAERQTSGSGFVALVLGGLIAAGIGYALAQVVPDGWPIGNNPAELQAVTSALAEQGSRIDRTAADLAELSQIPPPDLSAIDGLAASVTGLQSDMANQLAEITTSLAQTNDALAALDSRLNTLERRPVSGGAASESALRAYEEEIKGLRALIEAQAAQSTTAGADIAAVAAEAMAQLKAAETTAADLQAKATEIAAKTAAQAALRRIEAALEAGGAFSGALDEIEASGSAIPEPLRARSGGVPTVRDLQTAFPAPARLALDAARKATVGTGTFERISAFLSTQTGARSLGPREGDDPDAVLSRAEAAVAAGDLTTALAEIAGLPEAGQAEMAEWKAQAQVRLDALAALAVLAAAVEE